MNNPALWTRNFKSSEEIENWDDDDLDIEGDNFTFRSASITTNATIETVALSNRRDSISSHKSARSDVESYLGDGERQVTVPGYDEQSKKDAIAFAKRAGIPIPQNVPASALLGGTIKRLGSKKVKKAIQDDWDDGDLEFSSEKKLEIKRYNDASFPAAIRQVTGLDSTSRSSSRLQNHPLDTCYSSQLGSKLKNASNHSLERYRNENIENIDTQETIKISKIRQTPKLSPLITPTPQTGLPAEPFEDFELDLQLPVDDEPLKLSSRKNLPRTPSSLQDDSDEWGEGGSLGTRHAGKRCRESNRSSSMTALSPSASSSLTIESEDEGLDGLILDDSIDFGELLKKQQQDKTQNQDTERNLHSSNSKEDFLSGLEIGLGDVFCSKKLTINRNVKIKTSHQNSPPRLRAAVSLTFTNKSSTNSASRLPRPLGGHGRIPSSLEPVSESGGPIITRSRRSHSRLGGHSAHASVTNITTLTTSSTGPYFPSTPCRRELLTKPSLATLRKDPNIINTQLLKLKRSMPIIRSFQAISRPPTNSRNDRLLSNIDNSRPGSFSRPKTPIKRGRGTEPNQRPTRHHLPPFLPAGASNAHSHHVLAKNSTNFRRHDSGSSTNSLDCRSLSRAVSRSSVRSRSPRRKAVNALAQEAASKRILTKPIRRRHFGDGFELDAFDDLPTSRELEQKYIKDVAGRGTLRLNNNRRVVDQEVRLAPSTSSSLTTVRKPTEDLPRFARDTTASRLARENTLAQRVPPNHGAPLATLTNQWKAKVAASTGLSTDKTRSPKSKKTKNKPKKPQLIKPLGNCNSSKSMKGMLYNPNTYRWEGNDCDLSHFDTPSPLSTASIPGKTFKDSRQVYHEKESSTPRPALIQQVKSTHNVQVVGGMVFDPQRMCWLKMTSNRYKDLNSTDELANSLDSFNDEEEDVFKDVPDLEDSRPRESSSNGLNSDGLKEDFIVGEEFDVGPEFVKRQRDEEERWKRKVHMWIQSEYGIDRESPDWRWIIRDMVMNHEV